MRRVIVFLLLAAVPALAWADMDCAFRADRSLDIDPKGLSLLKLDTGAGDLVVEGVAGLSKIELRGKNLACWCALDQPCHADVLLELANQDPHP